MLIIVIFLNLVSIGAGGTDSATASTDYVGHAGGAITGLIWGLGFLPRVRSNYTSKLKLYGMMLTATFFILFFCLFYLTDK